MDKANFDFLDFPGVTDVDAVVTDRSATISFKAPSTTFTRSYMKCYTADNDFDCPSPDTVKFQLLELL